MANEPKNKSRVMVRAYIVSMLIFIVLLALAQLPDSQMRVLFWFAAFIIPVLYLIYTNQKQKGTLFMDSRTW